YCALFASYSALSASNPTIFFVYLLAWFADSSLSLVDSSLSLVLLILDESSRSRNSEAPTTPTSNRRRPSMGCPLGLVSALYRRHPPTPPATTAINPFPSKSPKVMGVYGLGGGGTTGSFAVKTGAAGSLGAEGAANNFVSSVSVVLPAKPPPRLAPTMAAPPRLVDFPLWIMAVTF